MKKCLSCLLVLLVLTLLPMFAIEAQAAETSGTCGENLTWTLDEEGTLTISGSGPMDDFLYSVAPWDGYKADILKVKMEDGITAICDYAFWGYDGLTSVTIPDSVTSIGDSAFSGCASLTSVTIPDSVASIGVEVFRGCSSLEGIWVDNGNPDYSSDDHGVLFDKDKSLLIQAPGATGGHYSVPDSVASIGYLAFCDCSSLTSVTIPDSVTSIGECAFSRCESLTSVTIPNSVTSIGRSVFFYCSSLASVTIPTSVTSIGRGAFDSCDKLSTIRFAGDAPSMGEDAFLEVTANAYYPKDNTTWTQDVRQNYGGSITWIPMCAEHKWGEWSVVTEATATTAGEKIRTCGTCGWEETEIIPATGEPVTPPVDDEPVTPPAEDDKPIANPFADVPKGEYYYDSVLWAVDNGITTGMTETTFAPDGTCTRAQIVTFLWRANGSPAPASSNNPFTDVPAGLWYTDAVLWAVEQGITTGTSATTFSPDASCTRGQVATFLYRAQGKPASSGTNVFTDLEAGAYYYDAVLWAVENGITNGMGDGTFAPDATCTRGQIVTFLYRAMA